jgi:transposase InsO family protein
MIPSMGRPGTCYDNGAMEAFWTTMKTETVYRRRLLKSAQASNAVFDRI